MALPCQSITPKCHYLKLLQNRNLSDIYAKRRGLRPSPVLLKIGEPCLLSRDPPLPMENQQSF